MIKLQPGDYVSTEGMTEEQYHAVCKAFIDAGAGEGESWEGMRGWKYIGWVTPDRTDSGYCSSGIFRFDDHFDDTYFKRNRELTIKQILGQEETKMTKITVFGQQESKKEEKKAIEFVYFFDDNGSKHRVDIQPHWDNITLLTMGEYDLIFAWDDDPQEDGCIYLGHWNDGVV